MFVAIWLAVAFKGNEPIHTKPIQVSEESSKHYKELGDYGQMYFMTYALLFIFVAVHNTIRIQLAHTSLTKYQPFSKLYLFASISLIATGICAIVTDGEANVRLAVLIITIAVAVFQWTFLVIVAREITSILGISVFLTK